MRPNSYEAYIYVDAAHIRQELKKHNRIDMFDPSILWSATLCDSGDTQPIRGVRMFFYEAIDDQATPEEKENLQVYLDKVERLSNVSVVTGFVRPGRKARREQKGIDVQIAVDALEAAAFRRTDAIILVSGDADFCPLADAVRRAGAFVAVFGFENRTSRELILSSDIFGPLPGPDSDAWRPLPLSTGQSN